MKGERGGGRGRGGEREGGAYCDRCGGALSEAGRDHQACRAAREFEPPRYCARCGRRTVVKVTPGGWSSHCTRHGLTVSPG